MKQSQFRYLGVFDLLLAAVFLAVFGVGTLTGSVVAGMALAGAFALLAGSVSTVSLGPVSVSWRGFAAGKYAALGAMLPGSYLSDVAAGTATQAELGLFVVTSVGAVTMFFFGYDVLRGSKHVEVEPDVARAGR